MKKALLYIVIALAAAACASKETRDTAPTVTDRSTAVPSTSASTSSSTTQRQQPSQAPTGMSSAEMAALAKRSVYFDYDSNSVKDEYRTLVTAHSRNMADKNNLRMRIEGNCDERGSREYNLALGQRRAESVKKLMTVLGVGDGRIETVSYGEEKPVAPGHDENAWSQNRRADIKYAGE